MEKPNPSWRRAARASLACKATRWLAATSAVAAPAAASPRRLHAGSVTCRIHMYISDRIADVMRPARPRPRKRYAALARCRCVVERLPLRLPGGTCPRSHPCVEALPKHTTSIARRALHGMQAQLNDTEKRNEAQSLALDPICRRKASSPSLCAPRGREPSVYILDQG